MRQSEGRGHAGSKEKQNPPEVFGMVERLLSTLNEIAGPGPAQRSYETAVESAARVCGGPVSLWRGDDEGPTLVSYAGAKGEQEDRELLAAMREKAALALEGRGEAERPYLKSVPPSGNAEPSLEALPVRTSSGVWGVVVFEVTGSGEGCGVLLEAISTAMGLAADRDSLNDEVLALRARMAAAEHERNPDDRYAAIGQLAGYAYRELDEILQAIGADLQKKAMGTGEDYGGALSESKRARDIVSEQLDLARLEMPVLIMRDLNAVVQSIVVELEDGIHSKQLRLMKRLAPDLPEILLDEDKIRVAVRKVLGAAIARSSTEGWLRVETAVQGEDVRLQVTWEEKGSPGGATDDIFVAFGPLDRGGMGLMVASRIIREHGGGVRVQRYESGSTALVLDFPIEENQDRRRERSRRSGLDRRRLKEL